MSKWMKEMVFSVIALSLLMTILQTPESHLLLPQCTSV
jgi:hypothetical protein